MSSSANAAVANPNVFDVNSLSALRRQVRDGDPKALKAAAQQFEALFLQMVLKSMRDATPREGLFHSEQTRLYESLLDQQMAQVLGSKSGGTGLAAMIERQLGRQNPEPQSFDGPGPFLPPAASFRFGGGSMSPLRREVMPPLPVDESHAGAAPLLRKGPLSFLGADSAVPGDGLGASATVREFASRLWPAAAEASRATGIPVHFMVAQAALETGWGKFEPRRADGSPSFNVFGIKAGRNWQGPVVEVATTEYVDGVAQRQLERFRAYGSYAEGFRDYRGLLSANPRYTDALRARDAASFAQALQRAGYATDPQYSAKLERIIGGTTLRQILAG